MDSYSYTHLSLNYTLSAQEQYPYSRPQHTGNWSSSNKLAQRKSGGSVSTLIRYNLELSVLVSVSNNPLGLGGWFVPIGHSSSSSVTMNGWTEATERLWARSAAGSLPIIFVYELVFLQLQGWLNLKSWDMKDCNESLLFKVIVLFSVWRINTFMQNDNSHLM